MITATDLPEPVRTTAVTMAKLYKLVGPQSTDQHAVEMLIEAVNLGVVSTEGNSTQSDYCSGPQGSVWNCGTWKQMLKEDRDKWVLDKWRKTG